MNNSFRLHAWLPLLAAIVLQAPSAFAAEGGFTPPELALQEFKQNPKIFMDRLPEKIVVSSGQRMPDSLPDSSSGSPDGLTPEQGMDSTRFIENKFSARRARFPELGRSLETRAAIRPNDEARNLVDQLAYDNPVDMENANLRSAGLMVNPWSGDYWPTYLGGLSKRYSDPGFPNSSDWQINVNYLLGNQPAYTDQLSPAEKYDLLVGDSAQTLFHQNINSGAGYYQANGKVDTWIGICHGWAPAAIQDPRPGHTVSVLAADGATRLNFFPDDVKALLSELWANGAYPYRFISGRCNLANPPTDSVGRVLDPDCFDTNPGTWHLSVVNQLGVAHRSFILDAAYDYQVWNQPALRYSYQYFNPQTLTITSSLSDAKVTRAQFTGDRFSTYRAPNAASFVGIVMDLDYIAETGPSSAVSNTPAQDNTIRVRYFYDLELDSQGRIIGGEWYQNKHPDFLWNALPKAQARAQGDSAIDGLPDSWDGSGTVPASWGSYAPGSSANGQPLAHVVGELLELANGG